MQCNTHEIVAAAVILGLDREQFWTAIGWLANGIFTSRFLVQWYATEKRRQVTVPVLFWWLSLVGSLLFLCYAVFYDRHHVFIFAYAFAWLPYVRNLVIHHRHSSAEKNCRQCGEINGPNANFCPRCGSHLAPDPS